MEKNNVKYMGSILKNSRLKLNLTQEELAESVGISARYVMAIENEGKYPSLDVWIKLVRALKLSADCIVYPELNLSADEDEKLIRMLRMLSNRDKLIIGTTMQEMLDNE